MSVRVFEHTVLLECVLWNHRCAAVHSHIFQPLGKPCSAFLKTLRYRIHVLPSDKCLFSHVWEQQRYTLCVTYAIDV
jgi:hypothetical protein